MSEETKKSPFFLLFFFFSNVAVYIRYLVYRVFIYNISRKLYENKVKKKT